MCSGTCRIPGTVSDSRSDRKYTCVEDFYLRAREDAYLTGGIENGMIVAGHTPTLSKDYMMYNAVWFTSIMIRRRTVCIMISTAAALTVRSGNARLACLCAETGAIYYL